MRKATLFVFCLFLHISGYAIEPHSNSFTSTASTENIDSMAVCVLQGWTTFLDRVFTVNCLLRNEVKESELVSGNLKSDFFVPAQLGYWMMFAIMVQEAKKIHPNLTHGYEETELLGKLSCMMNALEDILENHAFVDTLDPDGTGKKALYQVHKITGEAPRISDFDKTVSMLDNLYLITGLQFAVNWARNIDPILASRMDSALTEFDLSMWRDGDQFHLGGPENPRQGSFIDRILSEGRLVYPISLARNEMNLSQFASGMNKLRSNPQTSPIMGIDVEFIPFFGTALEKWVPTSILSTELLTRFGYKTLRPLVTAQEAFRCFQNRVGIDATGIADNDSFKLFAVSPAESSSAYIDKNVLIPSAISILAGVMAKDHPLAACNFENTIQVLIDSGQLASQWGPSNAQDCGSSLIDMENPTRGTLEIAQASVSLLNMLLGGNFIDSVLRTDSAMNATINHYAASLDNRLILREAEVNPIGTGIFRFRENAWSKNAWWLKSNGDTLTYENEILVEGFYQLQIRFSNDNGNTLKDSVTILVDGIPIETISLENTRKAGQMPGEGWDEFMISDTVDLGNITEGQHSISILMVRSVADGVELDALILAGNFEYSGTYDPEIQECCMIKTDVGPLGSSWPKKEINVYPNPIQTKATIAFTIDKPEEITIAIFDLEGRMIQSFQQQIQSIGEIEIEWNASGISSGNYSLRISGREWFGTKIIEVQ